MILPAFLPLAPILLTKIGGGSLLALISTIVVAGHLTDLSPLSATGAVLIAQAGPKTDKSRIFPDPLNQLHMEMGAVSNEAALLHAWEHRPRVLGLARIIAYK